ncbi:hypothetical protein EMPS_07493 [Entomortierella parvispora]|uniref:C2H2-type domain-containing protein n=1 Tax=Entomortierella parvispora TaxID=205924 RepID=A0A9P3HE88_9FUNG|nr:hypothetical protein EMPS_07493 [Entomortierella parvispora]
MFTNTNNYFPTSASSAASAFAFDPTLPSTSEPLSDSTAAAESALFQTLFAMPAPINTINQDFCLFDDETSFDYPLFTGNAAYKTGGMKHQPAQLSAFNNQLSTPQTPSLDLVASAPVAAPASTDLFGFDGCSAFGEQALIDTPYTPYMDTPSLVDTPLETPYLGDLLESGIDAAKLADSAFPLFGGDFTYDFASYDSVFTIEPNMLLPSDLTMTSAPASPSKSVDVDFGSDEEDDEFVSSRSAALVSGLKRKVLTPISPADSPAKKNRVFESSADKRSTQKRFTCKHCDRQFARLFNLHTHEKTHDPEQARPFICSDEACAKAFSRKHDLQRHEASVHKGERNFACQTCLKPFSRQDGLRRHLAVKGTCADNGWLAT